MVTFCKSYSMSVWGQWHWPYSEGLSVLCTPFFGGGGQCECTYMCTCQVLCNSIPRVGLCAHHHRLCAFKTSSLRKLGWWGSCHQPAGHLLLGPRGGWGSSCSASHRPPPRCYLHSCFLRQRLSPGLNNPSEAERKDQLCSSKAENLSIKEQHWKRGQCLNINDFKHTSYTFLSHWVPWWTLKKPGLEFRCGSVVNKRD